MAKIEELASLIIDEIETFQKGISQLQKETKRIEGLKLTLSTKKVEDSFSNFLKKLDQRNRVYSVELDKIQHRLDNSILFPSKYFMPIVLCLIVIIISMFFSVYQFQSSNNIGDKEYNRGANKVKSHIEEFFNDNPDAFKQYETWKIKQ